MCLDMFGQYLIDLENLFCGTYKSPELSHHAF